MTALDISKPIIGVLLLVVGVLFLYSPQTIIRINSLIKNLIADDKRVILYHKKIAIFLISLSFIALYMGGNAIFKERKIETKNKKHLACRLLCQEAVEDYYEGRIRDSLRKTLRVLSEQPDEEWALVHLGVIYEALNEKGKARQAFLRALSLYPENRVAAMKIENYNSDEGQKTSPSKIKSPADKNKPPR